MTTHRRHSRHYIPAWWRNWFMHSGNWWLPLVVVMCIGTGSMLFVGNRTYVEAPPRVDFTGPDGELVFSEQSIIRGQAVFLEYALMDYGSMFGDGAGRGPDFTADALHRIAQAMEAYYRSESGLARDVAADVARARVQRELKQNNYQHEAGRVALSASQAAAFQVLYTAYDELFRRTLGELLPSLQHLTADETRDLTAFFYWGAWVCATARPGLDYSYTNNWPFDPEAGNTPPRPVVFWSVIGTLGLLFGLGVVLFLHGRFAQLVGWGATPKHAARNNTVIEIGSYTPTPVQRATYKFFVAAVLLFVLQVFAGILTVHNFLGLNSLSGVNLSEWLPITVVRGWHLQLALLWISAAWIGGSVFIISMPGDSVPHGQIALVNILFTVFVAMIAGSLLGVALGPRGVLGDWWNFLGNQGWEFVEMGKLYQYVLMGIFILWGVILYRGVRFSLRNHGRWPLPKWLLYCVVAVSALFVSGFIATPETNFVIADFWRWAVVHMWVEAFFEVFATILVSYFAYQMGFVSHQGASRVVYIATLLFLGSGLLGISHNFYWNAKPIATLAIGSVFSTLQVVPLILLTLEAWQFRKLPGQALSRAGIPAAQHHRQFAHSGAFLFLLGVNFWNFLGAGVFGFIINLPIINYYEHGTYLTVNHGHAAFFGVYGNLSLAVILFCSRYLLQDGAWDTGKLVRTFWCFNIGLLLMVMVDLFPVGLHQLNAVMANGFWSARSEAYIQGSVFQNLTWARITGGALFVLGGLIPFAVFIIKCCKSLKQPLQSDFTGSGLANEPAH